MADSNQPMNLTHNSARRASLELIDYIMGLHDKLEYMLVLTKPLIYSVFPRSSYSR